MTIAADRVDVEEIRQCELSDMNIDSPRRQCGKQP
jgi:hypothetical protein